MVLFQHHPLGVVSGSREMLTRSCNFNLTYVQTCCAMINIVLTSKAAKITLHSQTCSLRVMSHEKDVDLLRLPFQHMDLLSSAGSSDHTLV